MRTMILPYKMGSKGAKALARALNVRRLNQHGPAIRTDTRILNWGSSQFNRAVVGGVQVEWVNPPDKVGVAADKLRAFQGLRDGGVQVVPFTRERGEAESWLASGDMVVARTILTGSSGAGIKLVRPGEELVPAPLWTRYVKKDGGEWRVHAGAERLIDFARKRKRNGVEADRYIRSHDNGWVFCRRGEELPTQVEQAAIQAIRALGLDFGAVDIIYSRGEAFVLEVNTAPGIEGTTVERYAAYFSSTLYYAYYV